jgi:two-component system, cell cycle sensor histidine kinase and response regulator CckA
MRGSFLAVLCLAGGLSALGAPSRVAAEEPPKPENRPALPKAETEPAPPLEKVVLQLAPGSPFRFAGYYAALERGDYRREGLDVEIRPGKKQMAPGAPLLAGEAQYAVLGSEAVLQALKGAPLVALAPIFQHSSRVLLVRQDSGIATPHDLKGKRIAFDPDGRDAEILAMLMREAVDLKTIVRDSSVRDAADLVEKRVDALGAHATVAAKVLRDAGVAPSLISPRSYGIDFYGDTLYTTVGEVRANPARAAAFRRATLVGWYWAMGHSDEATDLLLARPGVVAPPWARADLLEEAAQMKRDFVVAHLVEVGHVNPGRWRRMAETYRDVGLAQHADLPAGFVYDPNPPPPPQDLSWVRPLLWALLATILLAGLSAVWSVSLRRRVAERTRDLGVAHERLVAEAAARAESEAAVRGVLASLPVGVLLADAQGRIVESNAAARALEGGEVLYDGNGSSDRAAGTPPGQEALARALAERAPVPAATLDVRFPDGRRRTVLASAVPLGPEGAPATGAVAVLADITERVDLEQRLLQAQKMEAIGRLAGGIAHDFNNLLTVIGGSAEVALDQVDGNETVRETLQTIVRTSDRAAALTHRLLAFSRRTKVEPRVLDIGILVADMRGLLRRLLGEDVRLEVDVGAGLGSIRADPAQVEQVLMNLAVNARDAMPLGGRLTVTLSDVGPEDPGPSPGPIGRSWVLLTVTDTGSGMDAATRAHLFEPFFTTKEPGKGTGLGLSTVYGVVRQAEGHVEVDSEPGHGTRFRVWWPRVAEAGETRHETPMYVRPARGDGETILVVEDDPAVRSFVSGALADDGYRVLTASGAAEARIMGERHAEKIHLLLADVVMPKTSGRELAVELTEARPGLRVLFMSGHLDEAVARHGVAAGRSSHFLRKPFGHDALRRRVREALEAPIA